MIINARKKPVTIQAIQWDGTQETFWEIAKWAASNGVIVDSLGNKMIIPTLEGDMAADVGDYIIRGIKGEFYPCKPDIFNDSYEIV